MANRNAKLIERTLKDFSLGAMSGNGGGSTIVDALPAQGVEGTTYLLRKKDESKVFKAKCYVPLYDKESSGSNIPPVMIDADITLLMKEITTKLEPNLGDGLVEFLELVDYFNKATSEEWQTFISSNKVAIVKTEEDVSKLTEEVDYILQDLGEIGVENFTFYELKSESTSSSTTYHLAVILPSLNSCSLCLEKQGNELVYKERVVVYNSEATSSQPKYSFGEWEEYFRGPLVDTLTDEYIYDQKTLMSLENGDCYLINLTPTPQEVSYSYTQYVFDKGVYTQLGGGCAKYFVTVYGNTNMAGNYPGQITIEVDTPTISTVNDLFDWLKAKGFVTTVAPGSPLSPTAVYPNAIGMDTNESRLVAGCILYEEGDNRSIYFPKADIAIYGYRSDGYTLTYVNPEK